MCVDYPLFEEVLYRLAVCVPVAAWLGPRVAIAASGFIFAGLHVLYGNPSPDNLLGGFILAWAFLRSGTLVVPIALHSLGNLCAFLCHAAYFYLHA
jgi:membrane protease YdiL (CAAX protease family)